MITSLIIATVVGVAASGMGFATQSKDSKPNPQLEAAAQSAEKWVGLLDEGKFDIAYTQTSLLMQKTVDQKEWVYLMDVSRKPLGKVKARTLGDIRTAKNPKGLPEGDYMVVYYKSNFANRHEGEELLTLTHGDGSWRVLTYQVK